MLPAQHLVILLSQALLMLCRNLWCHQYFMQHLRNNSFRGLFTVLEWFSFSSHWVWRVCSPQRTHNFSSAADCWVSVGMTLISCLEKKQSHFRELELFPASLRSTSASRIQNTLRNHITIRPQEYRYSYYMKFRIQNKHKENVKII